MRCEIYKQTTDDWFPCYVVEDEGTQLVRIKFTHTGSEWRVCAWGADDCGMERDFIDKNEAWFCFLEVIRLEDVTKDCLKKRGFVSA